MGVSFLQQISGYLAGYFGTSHFVFCFSVSSSFSTSSTSGRYNVIWKTGRNLQQQQLLQPINGWLLSIFIIFVDCAPCCCCCCVHNKQWSLDSLETQRAAMASKKHLLFSLFQLFSSLNKFDESMFVLALAASAADDDDGVFVLALPASLLSWDVCASVAGFAK